MKRRHRRSCSNMRKYSAELEQRLREQAAEERREKLSQLRDWLRFKVSFAWIIFLCVFLVLFACVLLLTIAIWTKVLPIVAVRLGIPTKVGIALLIAMGFYPIHIETPYFNTRFITQINIPLYLVARQNAQVSYELFPIWLLRRNQPTYKLNFQPRTFLGINLAGALIPLTIALYQFNRVPASAILTVTAIVAAICYFSVTVVPGIMIHWKPGLFWVVPPAAALSSMWIVGEGIARADVSVAFAGGVLGSLIGADLLHLKDLQLDKAVTPLSIGGSGLDDGIVLSGIYSLLLAEWIPNLVAFIKL